MMGRLSLLRARRPAGGGENGPGRHAEDSIDASQLRAVAAEARLVASVDGTLGVLVDLWAGDERLHPISAPGSLRHRGN